MCQGIRVKLLERANVCIDMDKIFKKKMHVYICVCACVYTYSCPVGA